MGCNAPRPTSSRPTTHSYNIKFNPLTGSNYVEGGNQETLADVNQFYSARKDNKKILANTGAQKKEEVKGNFIHPKDKMENKIRTQSAAGRPRDSMMMVAPPKVYVHPTLGYELDKKALAETEARILAERAAKKQ